MREHCDTIDLRSISFIRPRAICYDRLIRASLIVPDMLKCGREMRRDIDIACHLR